MQKKISMNIVLNYLPMRNIKHVQLGQFLTFYRKKMKILLNSNQKIVIIVFRKSKCYQSATIKNKTLTINLDEYKAKKKVSELLKKGEGIELYSHRGNKSPYCYIKYNFNGLLRNNTILKLYAILYNLRRVISIKTSVILAINVDLLSPIYYLYYTRSNEDTSVSFGNGKYF